MIGRKLGEGQSAEEAGLSWEVREEWQAAIPMFERGRGKRRSGDVEIAEGLFWLGGGEEVVSSMEMSCKMGRNVTRRLELKDDKGSEGPAKSHGEL
jgi:hypothetical protein